MTPPEQDAIFDVSIVRILDDVPKESLAVVGAFFGVYPTGFACRSDHVGQIAAGPTVRCFELSEARMLAVSESALLL